MDTVTHPHPPRYLNKTNLAVVFDDSTHVINSQRCILANRRNRASLISKILDSLTLKGVSSCQSQGDTDYFIISSIVLAHAENMTCPVVLVAKDTTLLVMFLHGSCNMIKTLYITYIALKLKRILWSYTIYC